MKVLSTEGLTKLIDLIKNNFISNEDTQATTAVDAVETTVATLATVATTGSYNDLSGTPTLATVATTGSYNDLSDKPDLTDYALDADVVHKTGDETISGAKTFDDAVYIKNTEYAYNETPSSTSWTSLGIKDKNGTLMGTCERIKRADGSEGMQLNIFGKNGSWASSALGLGINSSGVTYTYCPTSDANGSIVTTVSKTKEANGYFKLGNGLIIQWGYVSGGTAKSGNVTFPTAFSSVNGVRVVACSNQANVNISVGGESTTGFTWGKSSTSAYIKWIAVGF